MVCVYIRFDSSAFMGTAEEIAKERADAQAKAELEELQGFTRQAAQRNRIINTKTCKK